MNKTKYYMVASNDRIIWGVGLSKIEALRDARKSLKDNFYENVKFKKAIECSHELWEYIFNNGASENDTWSLVDGIAHLDIHIKNNQLKQYYHDPKTITFEKFSELALHEKLNIIFLRQQ